MKEPSLMTIIGVSLLLLVPRRHQVDSFLTGGRFPLSPSRLSTSTRLFYKNSNHTEASSAFSASSTGKLEIPILGPLLNVAKPLIVGESLTLEHLTPLQWNTIETCVEAQQQQQQNDENHTNMATIDQAPLVAVLHAGRRDFATLAAVVGISASNDNDNSSLDTSSSTALQESLLSLSKKKSSSSHMYSDASKVRLMGIGRAKLSNQYVKSEEDETANEDDNDADREPILMAQMQLLMDSNNDDAHNKRKAKSDDDYGHASSPVHALNKLSMLASRIRFLHQDRQRIVRGLQAAQLKLEMAMEEWQDHDGIGAIFDDPNRPQAIRNEDELYTTLNSFLREFDGSAMEQYEKNCMSTETPVDNQSAATIAATSLPLSSRALRCLEMDNFGLGSSSTAFSDLTTVAKVLAERLAPFYSPERTMTEEFTYEAFSWVALESIQQYLLAGEIVKTLESCNTSDRLERLYRAMVNHKNDLTELAQAKSQELRDCGEECTGFF